MPDNEDFTQYRSMPLEMAPDEAILAEIVRRSSSSPMHAMLLAACRPDERSSMSLHVHILAGSVAAMEMLMSSVNDAVTKRKIELLSEEKEPSSATRKAVPRQL